MNRILKLFALAGFVFCLLIQASEIQSAVWYVNANATTGTNTGTSWANAYTNLQSALTTSATQPGDQIWVAKGTYKPTSGTDQTQSFMMPTGVAIYGGFVGDETTNTQRNWTKNVTILSGNLGSVQSEYVVTGDNQAILDGFTVSEGSTGMINLSVSPTIANCTFTSNTANSSGGGMYNEDASPLVINCLFTGNKAGNGGGIYNGGAWPMLTNCAFTSNTSYGSGGGGGVYLDSNTSPVLTNCIFTGNVAYDGNGGGMVIEGYGSVINCTFTGNMASDGGGMITENDGSVINCTFTGNMASDVGGGMLNDKGSVTNCIFTGNTTSGVGGGMSNGNGSVTNCTFTGNTADLSGGGICNGGSVINCIFTGNAASDGGGISNEGCCIFTCNAASDGGGISNEGWVTNCTFTNNTATFGGGMSTEYGGSVTNCILWDDISITESEIFQLPSRVTSPATLSCCDILGCHGSGLLWNTALGYDGGGNIDSNPLFVNINNPIGTGWFTSGAGLELQSSSPCIHAGTPNGAPLFDILGNSRQGYPDMGVYQYFPQPTPTPIPTPMPTPISIPTPFVQISNLSPSELPLARVVVGQDLYVDRDYTFQNPIPGNLLSQYFIETPNDAKDDPWWTLNFNVNQPVTLVAAVDELITTLPPWLNQGWSRRGDLIVTSDEVPFRDLYEKQFPAGTINLGANHDPGNSEYSSMYVIIILPIQNGSRDWQLYQ